MTLDSSLIRKYRPQSPEEIIGQDSAVNGALSALESGRSRSFLITGISGIGKTTLGRIMAEKWGAVGAGIRELDGGATSGVEDMRSLLNDLPMRHIGEGGSGNKAVIIDECQAISKNAWNASLKSVEEPPPHVIWIFLTTDPKKVPLAIKNRCHGIDLSPVGYNMLCEYAEYVIEQEIANNPGCKITPEIIDLVAKEARGSVRQVLSYISEVWECVSLEEAEKAITGIASNDTTGIEICRALMDLKGGRSKKPWKDIAALVATIRKDETVGDYNGIRNIILAYFTTVTLGYNDSDSAKLEYYAFILDRFSKPYEYGKVHGLIVNLYEVWEAA